MYATLDDILEQVDEATLIDLTDDEQLGVVDQTVIDRAVANADALIDAHCGGRYVVPFLPVPPLVLMYSVDLAAFNLYSRRTHVDVPEIITTRQKQALAHLRLVQKGEASVGTPANATSGTESQSALVGGNERIFTRKQMRNI